MLGTLPEVDFSIVIAYCGNKKISTVGSIMWVTIWNDHCYQKLKNKMIWPYLCFVLHRTRSKVISHINTRNLCSANRIPSQCCQQCYSYCYINCCSLFVLCECVCMCMCAWLCEYGCEHACRFTHFVCMYQMIQ